MVIQFTEDRCAEEVDKNTTFRHDVEDPIPPLYSRLQQPIHVFSPSLHCDYTCTSEL